MTSPDVHACSLQDNVWVATPTQSTPPAQLLVTLLVACPRIKNQLPIINMDVIIVGGQGVWAWIKVFKISVKEQ